ncbi:hypothetical protein [Aurantimonas endophytica]|uniref:Uncharacterized protein n=1 Tax=Aurantimonas endophytica TaxID=1522175 RepID=A0A7W6HFC5_9HYPH|nr:hypothetical protein [Aurantimonas endophytica]MBB4004206.1 hypothetical protein [Aurantimonas endophytica]MCO6405048.1 hypothetical protein [Aurantimonas endophytica]
MRIDVRVAVPRLRPVLPANAAALQERLRTVRALIGGAPLPRTSLLRRAVAGMASAEAESRREGPESL